PRKLSAFWHARKIATHSRYRRDARRICLFSLPPWHSVFASGPAKREPRLAKAAQDRRPGSRKQNKNQRVIGEKPRRRCRPYGRTPVGDEDKRVNPPFRCRLPSWRAALFFPAMLTAHAAVQRNSLQFFFRCLCRKNA